LELHLNTSDKQGGNSKGKSEMTTVSRRKLSPAGYYEDDQKRKCYVTVKTRSNVNNSYISGFDIHIAISGCRSLSQSLADTLCDLSMVVNPRFLVEISILAAIVSAT